MIVDDHALLLKGLALLLMSYNDLKLVGEAANSEEALALCAELHPDGFDDADYDIVAAIDEKNVA